MAGNLKMDVVSAVKNDYPKAWGYRNQPPKPYRPRFIVWDGEGMSVNGRHEYTYLCGYDGVKYYDHVDINGMDTNSAFTLILKTARLKPSSTHCIYGGSYDFNMLLRDVPKIRLERLWREGEVRWKNYRIKMVPRKSLLISDGHTAVTLWDVIGFFQSSFMSTLGIVLAEDGAVNITGKGWQVNLTQIEAEVIARGKKQRGTFKVDQGDYVAKYCQMELAVFFRLMHALENAVHDTGIHLNRWDGAGAVAGAYMRANHVKDYLQPVEDYQGDWYRRICSSYSAGRIELVQPGDHVGTIYHVDLNSAYPSAIMELPNLATAKFELCQKRGCQLNSFDLAYIHYSGSSDMPMYPFFHRSKDGSICYPCYTQGWHWGVEINAAKGNGHVDLGIHYHYSNTTDNKPFQWVADEYAKRQAYKLDNDPREKIGKLGLNSIYGRFAQQAGWRPGRKIPAFHQLELASLITAMTRAKIWEAIRYNLDSIIAIETDGIYSLASLSVKSGKDLGEWDTEILSRLTYVQSGVYFLDHEGEVMCRYRGFDPGALTRYKLLTAWDRMSTGGESKLSLPSTRFRTLGGSLITEDRFKL
jgi:hypothetical protein